MFIESDETNGIYLIKPEDSTNRRVREFVPNLRNPLPLVANVSSDTLNALDAEYPWFSEITKYLKSKIELQQFSINKDLRFPPILLAGSPGVGKTSYVNRLAELVGAPYLLIPAAGSNNSQYLRGTDRGYSSETPSAIVELINNVEIANPVVLIDEIDKTAPNNHNGSMLDVLLQLVEPSSAARFTDCCLSVPVDLSHVLYFATTNTLKDLPKPLLERFKIFYVPYPDKAHFPAIINNAINLFCKANHINRQLLPLFDQYDLDAIEQCDSVRQIKGLIDVLLTDKLIKAKKNALFN